MFNREIRKLIRGKSSRSLRVVDILSTSTLRNTLWGENCYHNFSFKILGLRNVEQDWLGRGTICCLEGLKIKFELIYLNRLETSCKFIPTHEAKNFLKLLVFGVLSAMLYVRVSNLFVIRRRNCCHLGQFKASRSASEKAAACFSCGNGTVAIAKKVPDRVRASENFTIFISHYAIVSGRSAGVLCV